MAKPVRDESGVSEAMQKLLSAPVDFDPLRDPNWRPSREDYSTMREAAKTELEKLRAALRGIEIEVYGRAEPYCRRIAEDIIEVLGPAPK